MSPDTLLNLIDNHIHAIHSPHLSDPILKCPSSTRSLLPTRPAALIKLAHSKIHSYPFSKVPICWRRLYTDASICEAVHIIQKAVDTSTVHDKSKAANGNHTASNPDTEDWVQEVVRLLDMAIIMAGAPERAPMIEELLATLQSYLEEEQDNPPPRKKIKRNPSSTTADSFPTSAIYVPTIKHQIPRRSALSMSQFARHLPSGKPLVITEALTHWPAVHDRPWRSPSYLLGKTFGGRRLVPVELGRSYTDAGWGQSIVTFREFMHRYMLRSESGADDDDEERNVYEQYRKESESEGDGIAYLAQHDLFAQIPSLRNDISVPDYCYTEPPSLREPSLKLEEPLLNAWFGPAGTVSPLHTDPYHNILCQVVGRKYVRLYAPEESERVYPRGMEGVDMSNTSQVDVGVGEEEKEAERDRMFPLFKEARYVDTVLKEGECLYIPVGWWHYVKGLSVSISVSFWWN